MANQPTKRPSRVRQQGLSLIELMIAMLLGLVLMGGVVQIFVGSKQTYSLQEAQSRLQENGRLAMHLLPHEVRLVDFQGCRARQNYTANVVGNPTVAGTPNLDAALWDVNGGITGTDNVSAGTVLGTVNVVTGTDLINIQYGASCEGDLVANMTGDTADIVIGSGNSCNLQANFPLLITDCVSTDIVRASSISTAGGNQSISHDASVNINAELSKSYGADAEVYALQSATFFIGQNPAGNSALYRRNNNASPATNMELVEGVEDMQILYGEDTDADGTANYYVSAPNVVQMQRVVSVKVSLLLQSLSDVNVTTQPVTYTFNGDTTTAPANDRQLHKVFTSTVTLRNRLP